MEQAAAASTADKVEQVVFQAVREICGGDAPITADTSFFSDLDIDSLSIVRLDLILQARLGLALSADDLDGIDTVGSLIRLLRERGQPVGDARA